MESGLLLPIIAGLAMGVSFVLMFAFVNVVPYGNCEDCGITLTQPLLLPAHSAMTLKGLVNCDLPNLDNETAKACLDAWK